MGGRYGTGNKNDFKVDEPQSLPNKEEQKLSNGKRQEKYRNHEKREMNRRRGSREPNIYAE